MPGFKTRLVRVTVLAGAAAMALVLASGPALAQKKESKQAAAFRGDVDKIKTSIVKTKEQLQATLAGYNAVLDQNTKKVDQAHKSLVKEIDKSEKMVADLRKQKDSLTKSGEKFFASWEAGVSDLTVESLKAASQQRLQAARGAYRGMLENMSAAGEVYQPFITSLKEQTTLMGRDLTPETLSLLRQDAAPELNAQGDELWTRIDAILSGSQKQEAEVDQAMDAEVAAEESLLDEEESAE